MNKLNGKKILIVGLLIGILFIIGGLILNYYKNDFDNNNDMLNNDIVSNEVKIAEEIEKLEKEEDSRNNKYHGIFGNAIDKIDDMKELMEEKKDEIRQKKENSFVGNILIIIGVSIIGLSLTFCLILYIIIKKKNLKM